MAHYAWVIDTDHLYDPTIDDPEWDRAGTMGPRDITDEQEKALDSGKGYVFKMYDDDKEKYYTGRIVADKMDEEACYGPLGDFGMPNAGAVEIRYMGHPEWNCG
jgi:hypothetical protein